MAQSNLYCILNDKLQFKNFLLEHNLILSPEKILELNFSCRNPRCLEPLKGFICTSRKRKLREERANILEMEGQDVNRLMCLRCKSCKTTLSPRTNGFLSFLDSKGRSNSKMATEKIIEIIYSWAKLASIKDTIEDLGVNKNTLVDWYNFCRIVCKEDNIIAHQRKLGDGRARGLNGETPEVVIQIDECLLRGKRLYNRGRFLLGNQPIPLEDREELGEDIHEIDSHRNYGRRITGPWIFGMVECRKQENGSYKSGEIRIFHVEKRDAATLLPIIRGHVESGSMVWSDQWKAYSRIREECDVEHETVNHSEQFVAINGTHTQNIERIWGKLRLKIVRNMKGTSSSLLNSHLDEYMYFSRNRFSRWEKFTQFLQKAALHYPIGY